VPGPDEGIINVRVGTAGTWLQSGQYGIVLDGAPTQQFVTPGLSATNLAVAPGTYAVSLAGLPPWCSAGDAPLRVEVPAEAVAVASFTVTCTGAQVTVATTGLVPDRDGYTILVDGTTLFASRPEETLVLGIAPGRRVITLDGVAPHCRPARPAWELEVQALGANPLQIDVSCASAQVVAEVVMTGGDVDPDGLFAQLASSALDEFGGSGTQVRTSAQVGVLPAGADWEVTLSDQAPNCRIEQPVRRGTLGATDTLVVAAFAVSCTPLPSAGLLISYVESDEWFGLYPTVRRWVDSPLTPLPLFVGSIENAEWSRDGTTMAYEEWATFREIVLRSRDRAEGRALGAGRQPVFTPDGQGVLVLESPPTGAAATRILRYDVAGGPPRAVLGEPRGIVSFDLSPDGRRLVMVRGNAILGHELVLVNLDGGGVQPLAGGAAPTRPRFSPDGTEILAEVDDGLGSGARWHALRTDGSGRRAFANLFAWAAAWSPDGSRIAFAERDPGSRIVSVRSTDGGDLRVLEEPSGLPREVTSLSWR
jgi:hypothetical protein